MAEFPAKYRGVCSAGDVILPGQECVYVEGEITHVECVDNSTEPKETKFQGTNLEDMGY